MTIGSTVFDAVYDALSEARASLRIGTHVIAECLCTNIDLTSEATEQGMYRQASITARIRKEDENPSFPLSIDRTIEVQQLTAGSQWIKLRIAGRRDIGGIIALVLEKPYE